jgi:hypothetical protein
MTSDRTASEICLWLMLAHTIYEFREACCCCIRIRGVKLPVLPRPGRDSYIFIVSIRLTSAYRVGGTQIDSRKKVSICSNLSVPICEVRRLVYREEVLPGGNFRYCGTQSLVLLQTAGNKNNQFHASL